MITMVINHLQVMGCHPPSIPGLEVTETCVLGLPLGFLLTKTQHLLDPKKTYIQQGQVLFWFQSSEELHEVG